jgi:hypothetical protein
LLRFDVPGFESPLTFCAPARELSVEHCVESVAFALGSPVARLDEDDVVHFRDRVPVWDAGPILEGNRLPRGPSLDRLGSSPYIDTKCATSIQHGSSIHGCQYAIRIANG